MDGTHGKDRLKQYDGWDTWKGQIKTIRWMGHMERRDYNNTMDVTHGKDRLKQYDGCDTWKGQIKTIQWRDTWKGQIKTIRWMGHMERTD